MDGIVRLVGGHNVKEGRIQVCYNGEWHSICSDNWSEMDGEADVVCSTLGYSAQLGEKRLSVSTAREVHVILHCSFHHSQFWSGFKPHFAQSYSV